MHENFLSRIWRHKIFFSIALSDTGSVRGFHLRSLFLIVVFAGSLGSVGFFGGKMQHKEAQVAVQAMPEYEDKIATLESEKSAREEQIKIFAHELGVLQARLDRFDVISERLFNAPEVSDRLEDIEAEASAQGGVEMPTNEEEYETKNLPEMKDKLSKMHNVADRVEKFMKAGLQIVTTAQMNQQQRPSVWPAIHERTRITSNYGYRKSPFGKRRNFHGGIDLAGGYNAPIVSAADGVVVFSGYRYNYGITVEIRHAAGFSTRYAHMNAAVVKNGERVNAGTIIGKMGSTGRSTGPHLHYEVLIGDTKVDPEPFLNDETRGHARVRARSEEFKAEVAALKEAEPSRSVRR